jgi:hypothetical protein
LDCLNDNRDDLATVCWNTGGTVKSEGRFATGVNVTMGEFCAACPSGCGPFRNQDSMYRTLIDEFESWPSNVRAVIRFCGSMSFALVFFFILL